MDTVLEDFEEFKKLGVATGDTLDYIKTCKLEFGGDG